jgi:signal transduction histidine kinase/CheY-like chemotaxis protein
LKNRRSILPSLFPFLTNEQDIAPEEKQMQLIGNLRLVMMSSVFILTLNSVINFFDNFSYSFILTASTCAVTILLLYFAKPANFNFVRYSFIVFIHIFLVLMNLFEGLIAGNYVYFFLLLIISIFIFDFAERKKLLFSYFCTIASTITVFLFGQTHSVVQRMTDTQERFTFSFNLIFSLSFICLLTWVILRRNYNNRIQLDNKQKFLDTVFNTSLDAVLIVNTSTNCIEDCNVNSLKIFNADISAFKGKPLSSLFAVTPDGVDINNLYSIKDQSWQGEIECLTPGGIVFPGYISIVPFYYNSNYYKKVSILDFSSIKKANTQLIEAKEQAEHALKAKSKFLSNMSHELRTPLNGIVGVSNLLLQEEYPASLESHFNVLKYSSEHMLALVNDVLDFSKFEADKMELTEDPFNILELLQGIEARFKHEFEKKKVNFLFDVQQALNRNFVGDSMRIEQVLSNLIANALKFTENGEVRVVAAAERVMGKTVAVNFKVIDTGIGIPDSKKEIIFESFTQADNATTRKYGGTGLGLAISKKIISLYNGQLQVTNNQPKGSCFSFTIQLPFSENGAAKTSNLNNAEVIETLTGLKVLLAEDNPVNMMIASRFLKKWNIDVRETVNGQEALQNFANETFDVLLIDLEMPVMDGYEFINEVRKKNPAIPAIAFTAAVYDNMHDDLGNKGFSDYIQKPFKPEQLQQKLHQYAKQKSKAA